MKPARARVKLPTARRADELGWRAGRLRSFLTLPELDKSERRRVKDEAAEEVDLRTLLARLGERVKSFASNPYLLDPRVVDALRRAPRHRDGRRAQPEVEEARRRVRRVEAALRFRSTPPALPTRLFHLDVSASTRDLP